MAALLLHTAILSFVLFETSFCLSGHLETVYECNTSGPLGMITGQIEDWQISASSTQLNVKDKRCAEKFGRVYQPNGYAWCAKFKSSTEWLQIDLGVPTKVTGLITQGKADGQEWVTSFMLSYSLDAFRWKYIDDTYGNQRVFEGNSDSYRLKHIYLDEAIFARFVKFHTLHWHGHPSLRVEIIGCQTCKRLVGLPPYVQMTSSSELSFKKGRSCRADDGHILTNNAWCAKSDDENQWLQYDVGPPALITGIVTKGRGDTAKKQWVTKFRLSYSNDSRVWHYYKDANHLPPKEFGANADKHLERYHFLNNPFVARYIRFNPAAWNTKISMRAGLLGCPHVGECEDGFMHVHPDTPCVENLSYKKETWINSRKQYKRTTTQTQTARSSAALAVDGNTNTTFQSCTILDNYYVETPLWSVDLGDKKRVSGIVILTWQTKNQEHRTTQKENVYNLDRLVVYVDSKERPPAAGDEQQQCGSVTRQNEAVMKPRVHVQCVRPLEGRYVHIQAWGVPNRRNRLFSAVLCEVMVYA